MKAQIRTLHSKAGHPNESLRQFAMRLLETGSDEQKEMIKDWFLNKGGASTLEERANRQAKKGGVIAEQKRATKNARSKTKK